MSTATTHSTDWRPADRWLHQAVPGPWRRHLLERGSLTRHLGELCEEGLSVRLLGQHIAQPTAAERLALAMGERQWGLVREVVLLGDRVPWVFARSIIPVTTMTGRLRPLRKLDTRPLGELLFALPGMRRGDIELARVSGSTLPPGLAGTGDTLWGRRSVFHLDDKPLLVAEIFLAGFTP